MPATPLPKRIRSRLNPDERISRIIAETRKILSEKGYENLVTSEVADRCGISEATIYKYFETKRDLLTRVAEQWFAELLDNHESATPKHNVRDQLRQLIWEHLAIIRREPTLTRFVLMELRADPGYRSMHIYELNRQFTSKILTILQDAIDSGEFRSDISLSLVRNLIFGGIEHQTWAYLRGEGDFDFDKAADAIADVVYHGMLAKRTTKSPAKKTAARK